MMLMESRWSYALIVAHRSVVNVYLVAQRDTFTCPTGISFSLSIRCYKWYRTRCSLTGVETVEISYYIWMS